MVLSNKKLKQKRRAEAAEALTDSTSQGPAEPQQSPNQLQETQKKPRLIGKRAKRRQKALSALESGAANAINGKIKTEQETQEPDLKESNGSGIDGGVRGKKREREKEIEGGEKLSLVPGANKGTGDGGKKKNKRRRKKEKLPNGDSGNVTGEMGHEEGNGSMKDVGINKKKKLKKNKENNKEEKKAEETSANLVAQGVDVKSDENSENLNKVYVGGIPYYSTEDDVRSFFDRCGTITEIDCMTFPESGRFRGIAIISFKTEGAAKRALALDGADMGGLFLKIQPYKATRGTKASDFSPPVVEGYNRIYAGNLSWDITEEDLRKLFSGCNIVSIRFGEDKETGEFKGYAHVDFSDRASLTKALILDQKMVCGRPVRIRCAVQNKGVEAQKKGIEVQKKAVEVQNSGSAQKGSEIKDSGLSSGKIKRRTCYDCGEKGHISSSCPKKLAADQVAPAKQSS